MRLTPLSPAWARHERAERLRRDRAAALELRAMYPMVEQLRLELTFEGTTTASPAAQVHVLHPPARAFFTYPCPYADCDGRFDLTEAVSAALASPQHHTEGTLECPGTRAGAHGSTQPCGLRLTYSVTATCK